MQQPQNKPVLEKFRLDGRRALVTGGSKGLGRVIAQALAEAGADVVVVSRTLSQCDEAAEAIRAATSRQTWSFAADVTVANEVDRLAKQIESAAGPIDILINNAGLNIRGPIQSLSETDWDAVLDVNLKAPWLLSRRFAPPMAERGWGRIIQLGSILSAIGIAGRTPYASSKAGVLGLTRVLAMEFAPRGVTVNAICPGVFATDMNRPLMDDPKKYAEFIAKIPVGRWGEPHELAGAAVFLASDAGCYVTGTTLFVDGGWTAQ
jgi:NAD(P)-dependent dehydrogenase (short-subunit alcohol dehydrogenase family)